MLEEPAARAEKPARGFWTGGQRTVRTDRWRLISATGANGTPQHELFDYASDPSETRNHAAVHPEVVRDLQAEIARHPAIALPPSKTPKKAKAAAPAANR